MKITNAYVNVTSPGRNFVTLKIETDEGIYGLGDATLNGRELAVASYLTDHVLPCILGRDPFNTEDIWQYLYRGPYWRRGPVTMAAIAAVDVALWDIKGKALNTPVYNLLGGKSREGVLVYCHAFGKTIDDALDDVARHRDMGYKAIRVQSGVTGLKSTYGVAKGRRPLRARRARPAHRIRMVHRALSARCPETVCPGARSVRRGIAPPARLPSPPDPHRSRPPRQGTRTLPPLLDRRPHPRRITGRLQSHPRAHHHAHRRGRSVQLPSGTPTT